QSQKFGIQIIQDDANLSHIPADCSLQSGDIRKFPFLTDPLHEINRYPVIIDTTGKIKQKHLDSSSVLSESRITADIAGAFDELAIHLGQYGVHPVRGKKLVGSGDISRRKSQRVTNLTTMHHGSVNPVIASEITGSCRHIAS